MSPKSIASNATYASMISGKNTGHIAFNYFDIDRIISCNIHGYPSKSARNNLGIASKFAFKVMGSSKDIAGNI